MAEPAAAPPAPPTTGTETPPFAAATPPPGYALYSPGQIFGASFLGSPLAGCILLAINWRRLGDARKANLALLVGVGALVLLFVMSALVPGPGGNWIGLAPVFVMRTVAKELQGSAFEKHIAAGGARAGSGPVVGIGVASLVGVLAIVAAWVALAPSEYGKKVAFPPSEVYYKDGASEADARALGQALVDVGYFSPKMETTVQLTKHDGGFVLSFVEQEGAWDRPEIAEEMRWAGMLVSAKAFGGRPLEVHLCDGELKVHRTIPIDPRATVQQPPVKIYFGHGVAEAEARTVAEHLAAGVCFKGSPGVTFELVGDSMGGRALGMVTKTEAQAGKDADEALDGLRACSGVDEAQGPLAGKALELRLLDEHLRAVKSRPVAARAPAAAR